MVTDGERRVREEDWGEDLRRRMEGERQLERERREEANERDRRIAGWRQDGEEKNFWFSTAVHERLQ